MGELGIHPRCKCKESALYDCAMYGSSHFYLKEVRMSWVGCPVLPYLCVTFRNRMNRAHRWRKNGKTLITKQSTLMFGLEKKDNCHLHRNQRYQPTSDTDPGGSVLELFLLILIYLVISFHFMA